MSVTHFYTLLHTVEMGCQMVQLLSAHIAGPTMCVNLTLAVGQNLPHKLQSVDLDDQQTLTDSSPEKIKNPVGSILVI